MPKNINTKKYKLENRQVQKIKNAKIPLPEYNVQQNLPMPKYANAKTCQCQNIPLPKKIIVTRM